MTPPVLERNGHLRDLRACDGPREEAGRARPRASRAFFNGNCRRKLERLQLRSETGLSSEQLHAPRETAEYLQEERPSATSCVEHAPPGIITQMVRAVFSLAIAQSRSQRGRSFLPSNYAPERRAGNPPPDRRPGRPDLRPPFGCRARELKRHFMPVVTQTATITSNVRGTAAASRGQS
jgi:hypothetical protein